MLDQTNDIPTAPLPAPRRGFWRRLADGFAALARGGGGTPPERSVAFSIAVISLGAKLAKADGVVRTAEVRAFRRVFVIPRAEEKNAARVFDLARQTPLGYDAWARRLAGLFPPGDPVLGDVIEGLCLIAVADGVLSEAERAFILDVGTIFGLAPDAIGSILMRHDNAGCAPCAILGVAADTPIPEARARWRALVREAHPDRAIARGLPPEAVRLAEARTRALNTAWDAFRDLRAGAAPEP